ncbi:MAG: type II toxin-antitoxin system VapC family toxin [Solirubrobacterales bacterium]|nr:type II toxin-antitoxin system VapC family toxin [Solirubrobacterales bacterium]
MLVYAKGADHPLREPCRDLVLGITDGLVAATTTPEVIQEFVHVRARRGEREEAVLLGRHYAALLAPLITVDQAILEHGLSIFDSCHSIGSFDSVLAAVAARSGLRVISSDRDFSEVPGLEVIFPDQAGVESAFLRG